MPHGDENSARKNIAPFSFTVVRISENASMWVFRTICKFRRTACKSFLSRWTAEQILCSPEHGRISSNFARSEGEYCESMQEQEETTRMNATVKEALASQDFDQLKERLKATWSAGDYDAFSRFMEKEAEEFFRGLGVAPGTRLLDVGCGAGQVALIAARAGAKVHGCDIAANWLEKARGRAAAEGLEIVFEEGDAESLPYEDAQFDTV